MSRVICYQKDLQGVVQFAVSPRWTFQPPPGAKAIPLTPSQAGLQGTRHDSFDWTVGDRGRTCTLWEIETHTPGMPLTVPWGETWEWHTFGQLAHQLVDRQDRRFLLLAVQYISAGGVPQDAVAAPTDDALLKAIKELRP